MENEAKLEIGYGLVKGGEAFAAGVKAAKQALTGIQECAPSLVLVFASVRYELEELLRGVHYAWGMPRWWGPPPQVRSATARTMKVWW